MKLELDCLAPSDNHRLIARRGVGRVMFVPTPEYKEFQGLIAAYWMKYGGKPMVVKEGVNRSACEYIRRAIARALGYKDNG